MASFGAVLSILNSVVLITIILSVSKGESSLPVVLNTWPFTDASDKGRGHGFKQHTTNILWGYNWIVVE